MTAYLEISRGGGGGHRRGKIASNYFIPLPKKVDWKNKMDYSNKYKKAWLNKFQGIRYLRELETPVDLGIQSKMQNSITCLSES